MRLAGILACRCIQNRPPCGSTKAFAPWEDSASSVLRFSKEFLYIRARNPPAINPSFLALYSKPSMGARGHQTAYTHQSALIRRPLMLWGKNRSVVDLKVTAVKQKKSGGKKQTIGDMAQDTPPPPPMSLSCSSAAMLRINGKGHLMYTDK